MPECFNLEKAASGKLRVPLTVRTLRAHTLRLAADRLVGRQPFAADREIEPELESRHRDADLQITRRAATFCRR